MKRLCTVVLLVLVMFSGCLGTKKVYIGPKTQVSSHIREIIEIKRPISFFLENESGNIDIYLWNERAVKFEITKKYRDIDNKDELIKKLSDINFTIEQDEGLIRFISSFSKELTNPMDERLDMEIYLPYGVKSIDMKIGTGRVRVHDSLECNLKADIKNANVYINKFKGLLDYQADMGNLSIDAGKILNGSHIEINMGNININAAYDLKGEYSFKTSLGNINLSLPGNSPIEFASRGSVKVNEFEFTNQPVLFNLVSDMGEISIRKSQ